MTLRLPPVGAGAGEGFRVASLRVDGVALDALDAIPGAQLAPGPRRVEVELAPEDWPDAALTRVADPDDWRTVFGPRAPVVEVRDVGDGPEVRVGARDDGVRIELLRDGAVVADDLRGPWRDPDVGRDDHACYTARAVFADSGLASQHAEPQCFWGADRVAVFEADALEVVEGERADEHGRRHVRDPGGGGVAVARFEARYDGRHAVQVVYGNGGPVETGVTCAVRRVEVVDLADGAVVGGGVLALPHLGAWDRWADSTFAHVELRAGRAYRIAVHGRGIANMSSLAHFADYTGGPGGADGPFGAANISAVKVLAR